MNHIESAIERPNNWWRYVLLVLVSLLVANLVGGIPLGILMYLKASAIENFVPPANPMNFEAYGINPLLGLSLAIIPFLVGLMFFVILFKPLHKQSFLFVINGTNSFRWKKFLTAFAFWAVIMMALVLTDYLVDPSNYIVRFNPQAILFLFIVAIVLLPFQTAFEEVLFRGYLTQGVGLITRNRWIAIFLPSIAFALMHGFNPEVSKHGFLLMMVQYFSIAFVFGLISWFDDGIELAMGAHAANNIFLSLVLTADESALQTPALLKSITVNPVRDSLYMFLGLLFFMLVLKLVFKWDLKSKISQYQVKAN